MVPVCTQANTSNMIIIPEAPNVTLNSAERPDQPDVFNTVAVPIRARSTSTRWMKIMRARVDEPALMRMTEEARELAPEEQAAFVQSMMHYVAQNSAYNYSCSDDGYWAPADETLMSGRGDCIDIAVAKMEALRLLGIPRKDLYLTTGFLGDPDDIEHRRESAGLLVRIGEKFWLLPERPVDIIEANSWASADAHFTPVLTYGVGMTWVHGRMMRTAMIGEDFLD